LKGLYKDTGKWYGGVIVCQASEGKYKLKWDDGDVRIYEKNRLTCFFALITAHYLYISLITAKILTQKKTEMREK
jgi:hypothetical protein